jgi:hypothetical protein
VSAPLDPGGLPARLCGTQLPSPFVAASVAPALIRSQVEFSGDEPEEDDDPTIELSGTQQPCPATTATSAAAAGFVLGSRYRLEAVVGRGASCVVFRARDLHRGSAETQQPEFVALKLLRPEHRDDPVAISRLQRQFEQMRCLSSPGIVRVFGLECDGAIWFMTMELVAGRTVKSRMASAASIESHLEIIGACCRALEHAHALGILHGDLKPSNVMVADDGAIKLIDFGSTPGGGTDADSGSNRTQAATPLYASPQILAGEAAEARDDVFSVACLSHSMLSGGQHPFGGHPSFEDGRAKVDPTYARSIPRELFEVIGRGLSAERERRPASVGDFLRELTDADRRRRDNAAAAATAAEQNSGPAHQAAAAVAALDAAPRATFSVLPRGRRPGAPRLTGRTGILPAELTLLGAGRESYRGAPSSARLAALVFAIIGAAVVLRLDPTSGTLHSAGMPIIAAATLPELPALRIPTVAAPQASAAAARHAGIVSFQASTVRASAGQSLVALSVTRQQGISNRAAFAWRVLEGTARPGIDYAQVKPQVVSFVDGQAVRTLFIPLLNAGAAQLARGARSFTVVLEQVSGGPSLGRYARATVAIDPSPGPGRFAAYQARIE